MSKLTVRHWRRCPVAGHGTGNIFYEPDGVLGSDRHPLGQEACQQDVVHLKRGLALEHVPFSLR
jgi:hypothetical protein